LTDVVATGEIPIADTCDVWEALPSSTISMTGLWPGVQGASLI
jgi:hypothetical protein